MAGTVTQKSNIVIPEVMGQMLSAKIPAMIRFTPFAEVDRSLVGVPGDTKTVPAWDYVGDAEDVAEGEEVNTTRLTATTTQYTIKKAMKSIAITQESINSGAGDPIGVGEHQLAQSIVGKVDNDVLDVAMTSSNTMDASTKLISYAGVVDMVDMFDEEEITDKVLFVNPKQVTTLRKDPDFMDKNKYGNDVMVSGEIGQIGGARIVPSKKIKKDGSAGTYKNVMIKLEPASADTEFTEVEAPAVTIFLKADVRVDHEWMPKKQQHDITAVEYYGVALTNASKVVVATFKG